MSGLTLLQMESMMRDSYRVKLGYIDICDGDLVAGLLLGQIVYWNLNDKNGRSKLRVTYHGRKALAKARGDWYEEIRVTARQYDRAIKILIEKGFVDVENSMFDGKRTPFIMFNEPVMIAALSALYSQYYAVSPKVSHRNDTMGNSGVSEREIPLTEITTKTTSETLKISIDDSINGIVRRYADKFREHTANEHFHLTEDQMDEVEHNIQHAQNEMGIDDEDMTDIVDHHFKVMPIDNDGHISYFASGDGLTGVIRRYAQDLDLY